MKKNQNITEEIAKQSSEIGQNRTVYILFSSWLCNGNNSINEIVGIYDCLTKAQQSLASNVHSDLSYHPYENIWCDGPKPAQDYDIYNLANMFHDDPDFYFPVRNVKLYNGEDDAYCEDWQSFRIEEETVL